MTGSPSPVQVAPSGGGPNVDALGLTNSGAVAVDRQVVVIGDPSTWGSQVAVLNGGMGANVQDGLGNAVNSLSAGLNQNGLLVAQGATNFVLSATNSSSAQLAPGASFVGAIETIFNQQDISMLITSDQNGTLTLTQYIDAAGVYPTSAWTYNILAGIPFSRSFTGNGNYFNLSFTNTGIATTTELNINTAYGTLMPSTNLGNLPVALNEINGAPVGPSLPVSLWGVNSVSLANIDGTTNTLDNPTFIALSGDPGGDFAGVPLLDEVVSGHLGLATFPLAPGQGPSGASQSVVIAADQARDLLVSSIGGMGLNYVLFNIDTVSGYPTSFHSFYCEVDIPVGYTAGAFIFEGSNTGLGTWAPVTVYDDAVVTGTPIIAAITPAANTQRFFSGKTPYRFLRLRVSTAFVGATPQAVARFSPTDYIPRINTVGNPTAANLNATVVQGTAASLLCTASLAAGTNNVGAITPAPSTNSIGLTSLIVNAGGALAAVKASAGNLYGFSLQNNNATVAYLEFWNVAAGSVTLGTTTPIATYIIPASGSLTILSPLSLMYSATALSYAVVTSYNGTTPASVTGTIVFA